MSEEDVRTLRINREAWSYLLHIARESLETFVRQGQRYHPEPQIVPAVLQERASTFVTLRNRGQLRGCIGSTQGNYPLAEDAARNAVAAARDPRFAPVTPLELPDIKLEVTILQPPRILVYEDEADLLRKLRPGIDGVIISWLSRRALLLPQVWERIRDPAQFIQALCHKGNIPYREIKATPPSVVVHTFQAEIFAEEGYFVAG